MSAPTSPYLVQQGFSEESAFGTAIADTGNFTTIVEGAPFGFDPGIFEDKEIKYRNQPYADTNDSFTTEAGGLRVITMNSHPVRRMDLAPYLYSVTQTVSEAAGSPYQKDFDIASTWTQPDFSANAGYFVTLGIKDTIASNHRKWTSCVLKDLTLDVDLTSDPRMMASGNWISGFSSSTSANFNTGTWQPTGQNYYNWAAPTTKTLDSQNIFLLGFSVTFNNNCVRLGNDSSGDAENYSMTMFEITGSLKVLYDTNTDGYLAQWISQTNAALRLTIGTNGNAGYFDMAFPSIEFTGNEQDYTNEVGRVVDLPWKAMGNTTGSDLFNGEIEDGSDFGW